MDPKYQEWATKYGQHYGVRPELLINSMRVESSFNPNAVSPKGARGLAQFMPGTALRYNINPDDPEQAIKGMAMYYRDLLGMFQGDEARAIAAYNWGEHRVLNHPDPSSWPEETRNHVAKVQEQMPQSLPAGSMPAPQYAGGMPNLQADKPHESLRKKLMTNAFQSSMPQGAPGPVLNRAPGQNSPVQKASFMPGESYGIPAMAMGQYANHPMFQAANLSNMPKPDPLNGLADGVDLKKPGALAEIAQSLGLDATSGMDIKSKNQLAYDTEKANRSAEIKEYMQQANANQLPPGYGSMGHAAAGLAAADGEIPGYQNMQMYAEQALPNILAMLFRLGGGR